ncbi:N-alpha-acetyltransferase 60 isoform X2, partial [Sigmodon hispidus]
MTEVVPSSALSEVSLRLLFLDDLDSMKHLCGDWFPIEYPDSWYPDITSNKKFFSLAITTEVPSSYHQAHSLVCSFLPWSSSSSKGGIEYSRTICRPVK